MELLLLAVALSMDCVALAISYGAKYPNFKLSQITKVSFFYGFFQGFMPLLGFVLGLSFVKFIAQIDHFITLVILGFLGAKMIKEAFEDEEEELKQNLSFKEIIVGAIATSIDAMAVGVTFAFAQDQNVLFSCFIIMIVCFAISVMAFFIGKKLGKFLEKKALILGGVILIGIGVKILLEHLGILEF